ncbi:F-box protein CPR1-like [Ipomoea triloba]|uniref:F-box protein CPR1-like n=1 Tax=Ipomoea triloba TaxID=35885 RepID=UPI00125D7C67|nr:F-box protein CPR1-like [Ipomoea triloba]
MEASAPLSNIPNDIIRHILLQLPMKFVIRCQCLCKQWRSLIDDSDFKLSYRGQRRVVFLSHEYRLCSCNGFVLLVGERDIWLWNPTTRCLRKVLKSPYREKSNPTAITAAGLCYDSYTRDYKVVLLLHSLISIDPFVICASFIHKEWRPVQFPCYLDSAKGGIEFRNTFYWWAASDIKDCDWIRDHFSVVAGRNRIIYFDPAHDEFRILPTSDLWHQRKNRIVGLRVIDKCLCMASFMVQEEEEPKIKTIQVWIMKEYGRQESWMTAFTIQMPHLGDINGRYGITFYSQNKNAHEVLFLFLAGWCGKQTYVYDRKKNKLKEDLIDFLTSGHRFYVRGCFYVESFACPDRPQYNGLIWRGDDDKPSTNT